MESRRYKFFVYQFPVILWAVIIFTISSMPHIVGIKPQWTKYDKIVHFIEYGVFGYFLTRALYYQNNVSIKKISIILALIIGILFAGIDEMHQKYIPGRLESFWDFIADAAGIIVAQFFFIGKSLKNKNSRE